MIKNIHTNRSLTTLLTYQLTTFERSHIPLTRPFTHSQAHLKEITHQVTVSNSLTHELTHYLTNTRILKLMHQLTYPSPCSQTSSLCLERIYSPILPVNNNYSSRLSTYSLTKSHSPNRSILNSLAFQFTKHLSINLKTEMYCQEHFFIKKNEQVYSMKM